MVEISEIIKFLEDKTGTDHVSEHCDITIDLGVDGDDFDELIMEFGRKYKVDISSCIWYFHCGEEGSWNSVGRTFFKSLDERVKHISVTPAMLSEFAKTGKWSIEYPAHKLPKSRYDILINQVLVLAFVIYLIYKIMS